MDPEDRGPLLYAYRPIPANPMTVALLLLVLVVTLVLGPIAAAPEGLWPLGGLCFVPLVFVIVAIAALKPSLTLVYENGIEVSLPLWERALGRPRYVPWSEIRDVYPRAYEVAGSFLSPFASSAGTLVHTGIGIETKAGRRMLVRFTPGSIRSFRSETRGYVEAMTAIRQRFSRHGERMITTARMYTDEQVLRMQERARAPLVSIEGVFVAFLLPPAIVAAVLFVATLAGMPITTPLVGVAILAALVPPGISMAQTLRQSERRNDMLSELAKFQEHLREQAASTPAPIRP